MRLDIIRAWKDELYRLSLSKEQRASLPECPVGEYGADLTDEDLQTVFGGAISANGGICNSYKTDCSSLHSQNSCGRW